MTGKLKLKQEAVEEEKEMKSEKDRTKSTIMQSLYRLYIALTGILIL